MLSSGHHGGLAIARSLGRLGVPVHAVDTTGAGDAFIGALAMFLAEGRVLLESVRWASAAAALSVTKLGAQSSFPSRADVEGLFLEER